MHKLLRALPLLGLTFFLGAVTIFPTQAHAQAAPTAPKPAPASKIVNCNTSPKDPQCSFDPNINPLFKGKGFTVAVDSKNPDGTLKILPDTENRQCVTYAAPGVFLGSRIVSGCIAKDGTFSLDGTIFGGGSNGAVSASTEQTTADGTKVTPPQSATEGSSCSYNTLDLSACLLSIMASLVAKIASLILLIVAGILYLANYLLGWSTYVTVYQFGNLIGNSQGLLSAWGVLRDVANIGLLFGFIFMGISTILNLSSSEYTAKRALPTLIIFALLLNFSLLAAEAVIDVSNALAVSIYSQAGGCGSGTDIKCITDQGIGGTVLSLAGISSAFSASWLHGLDNAAGDAVIEVGLIIFLLITALVLFAAAIMLIIRAVMLGLLMVTAPIGFAGMAIPPLHEVAKLWWTQLLAQAFFAPVYFLIAFVSLKMMEGIVIALGTAGKTNEHNLAAVFSASIEQGGSSNASVGITFALLIGFMIAALMFAKKSSAIGTGFAIKGAGGLAFGTLGYVGRNTAGRVAYSAGRSIQSSKFGTSRLGQFTAQRFQNVGKASFDGRASAAGGALAGATGNLGTANKGGYAGAVHDREEAQKKYAKAFERTEKEKEELVEIDGQGNKGGTLRKAEAAYTDLKAENKKALEEATAASEASLEPERNQIAAQNFELESAKEMATKLKAKANEAQAVGDSGATALLEKAKKADQQVTALQGALNTAEEDYRKKTEANLAGITSKIEGDKSNYEELKKKLTDRKNALLAAPDERRRAYAEELHTPGALGLGAKNAGDHHASEEIFRELAKSPEDKQQDRIIEALKQAAKDGRPAEPSDSGAPAAGGGAPAAH